MPGGRAIARSFRLLQHYLPQTVIPPHGRMPEVANSPDERALLWIRSSATVNLDIKRGFLPTVMLHGKARNSKGIVRFDHGNTTKPAVPSGLLCGRRGNGNEFGDGHQKHDHATALRAGLSIGGADTPAVARHRAAVLAALRDVQAVHNDLNGATLRALQGCRTLGRSWHRRRLR